MSIISGGSGVSDEVILRLILVSGHTHDFKFSSTASAFEICQSVFDNWPAEWETERVSNPTHLKLIYHGRFLHGSITLNALGLQMNKITVMHLVTRENLPESPSNDDMKRDKRRSCCACSVIWLFTNNSFSDINFVFPIYHFLITALTLPEHRIN